MSYGVLISTDGEKPKRQSCIHYLLRNNSPFRIAIVRPPDNNYDKTLTHAFLRRIRTTRWGKYYEGVNGKMEIPIYPEYSDALKLFLVGVPRIIWEQEAQRRPKSAGVVLLTQLGGETYEEALIINMATDSYNAPYPDGHYPINAHNYNMKGVLKRLDEVEGKILRGTNLNGCFNFYPTMGSMKSSLTKKTRKEIKNYLMGEEL